AERTVVALAVFADVNALHEAHVGLEEKLRGLASFGVNSYPRPQNPAITHVAVEIGDFGRLDGAGHREMMDRELLFPDDGRDSARNGPGSDVVPGQGPRRPKEAPADGGTDKAGTGVQELTAGHGPLLEMGVAQGPPPGKVVVKHGEVLCQRTNWIQNQEVVRC